MAGNSFDAIIVLGAGITRKGNLSMVAKSRMNKALELHRGGVAPRIIVTGKNEVAAMKKYAVRKGIRHENIFCEEKSVDTIGNAFFTRKLFFLPIGWKRAVVVTSPFHMQRARLIFKKVFGKGHDFKFVRSIRVLPDKVHEKKVVAERALTAVTLFLSSLIADGDMQAIENFLSKSPMHNLLQSER